MAEVTVASTFADTKMKRIGNLRARQYTVVVGADGDTFTTGIKGIREVWWRGAAADQNAHPRVTNTENGQITFDCAASVTGQVLILSRG